MAEPKPGAFLFSLKPSKSIKRVWPFSPASLNDLRFSTCLLNNSRCKASDLSSASFCAASCLSRACPAAKLPASAATFWAARVAVKLSFWARIWLSTFNLSAASCNLSPSRLVVPASLAAAAWVSAALEAASLLMILPTTIAPATHPLIIFLLALQS